MKGELEKRIKQLERERINAFGMSQISPSSVLDIVKEMRNEFPHSKSLNNLEEKGNVSKTITIEDFYKKQCIQITEWFEKWLGRDEKYGKPCDYKSLR